MSGSNATPYIFMAALCYVPILLTKPGVISVDSKQYLYLDPKNYLIQAASIWSPNVDMGTVTHQIIGFLMPMGEWFWLFSVLHVPVFLAQRLWLGSVYFMSGAGVYYFCKTIGLSNSGSFLSGLVYMFSPYMFQYEISMSDLLAPMAALGWMMAFTYKALKTGKNRYCLLFAVAVALSGTINATSFIYVALGPVILTLYAVIVRDSTLRRAFWVSIKILGLSLLVSLYWIEGLVVEGAYGVNILKLSESLTAISATSSPAEVFRGLGYWYFYASDSYGPIVKASVEYQTWTWLIFLSFLIPAISIISAVFIKWRYKGLSLTLIVIGMIVSVGLYPLNNPSFFGSKIENFMNTTEIGLALRSSTRATPLVVLGIAMLIGALANLIKLRSVETGFVFVVVMTLIAVFNTPGVFLGETVTSNMARGPIPSYWYQAGKYLNTKSNMTRVIQVPGQPFETYNFGTTIDPILPGLTNRPTVERRQVPLGSNFGVNLLDNFDNTIQRSNLNPNGLAAVLRLMSAGDMLVTNDLAYERYQLPSPPTTMKLFQSDLPGFSAPKTFGTKTTNYPTFNLPYYDTQTLATPFNEYKQYPLVDYPVNNARPIVRLESAQNPLIIDGDGLGVIEAANAGLLNNNPTIFYSASMTPAKIRAMANKNATLVVTDSNRKQTKIWSTFLDQNGEIETAAQNFANANNNQTDFNIFPNGTNSTRTVVSYENVKSISASSYGYPYGFAPEFRPYAAFDSNLNTGWMTGALADPVGQWIKVNLNKPVVSDQILLNQMLASAPDRWISKVKVSLDLNSKSVRNFTVNLKAQSLAQIGQKIVFPITKFDSVKITIAGIHNVSSFPISDVGFSQININNISAGEVVVPPSDLLKAVGKMSSSLRLVYIFSRQTVGSGLSRVSPETNIVRQMNVPTSRLFSISGTATLSTSVSDSRVNSILYSNAATKGNILQTDSNSKLKGDLSAYSGSVVTGGKDSAWISPFDTNGFLGSWIQFNNPKFIKFNQAALTVYDDGQHSLPAEIKISTEQGQRLIKLNKKMPFKTKNNLLTYKLKFPTIVGKTIRITFEAVNPVSPKNYYGSVAPVLPLGVNYFNVGYAPGSPVSSTGGTSKITLTKTSSESKVNSVLQNALLIAPSLPKYLPNVCRNDLATIDGKPIWLKVIGTVTSAIDGRYLGVVGCGPDASGILLKSGQHIVTTAVGSNLGINIDQIVFDSNKATSGVVTDNSSGAFIAPAKTLPPPATIKVKSFGNTMINVKVDTVGKPVWLVLGENYSTGWQAKVTKASPSGSSSNQGLILRSNPSLIDAYSNGWLITPPPGKHVYDISLSFAPQNDINYSLIISFGTLFLCISGALVLTLIYRKKAKRLHLANSFEPLLTGESMLFYSNSKISAIKSIIFAVISGLFVGLSIKPLYGLIVGIIAFVFLRLSSMRILVILISVALLVAGVFGIVFGEYIHGYAASGSWPSQFNNQSDLIYLSITLVVLDSLIISVRNFRYPKP